jgi:hypothetical protein
MIGQPYNPNNCCFLANQALNANQFDPNVPDTANTSVYILLWDFVSNKILWVDARTNIIKQELGGGGGIQNEAYSKVSAGPFDLNTINTVYGANYLLLNPGTYVIDAEYTYEADPAGAETATIQIRTNTNQALTSVDVTDVVVAERDTNPGSNTAIITQTVKAEPITFATPVIVKTALAVGANAAFAQNIILSALLVK